MNIEELQNLAILSKLEIKKEQEKELLEDMQQIISFANKISSVKVQEEELKEFNNLQNVFRKDEVLNSYPQEEILKNTKTAEDGFFYLKNKQEVGGEEFDF